MLEEKGTPSFQLRKEKDQKSPQVLENNWVEKATLNVILGTDVYLKLTNKLHNVAGIVLFWNQDKSSVMEIFLCGFKEPLKPGSLCQEAPCVKVLRGQEALQGHWTALEILECEEMPDSWYICQGELHIKNAISSNDRCIFQAGKLKSPIYLCPLILDMFG